VTSKVERFNPKFWQQASCTKTLNVKDSPRFRAWSLRESWWMSVWGAILRRLFDDPIRLHQPPVWYHQAELLGSFQSDDELKLRRLLYGNVCGLGAFEDKAPRNSSTLTRLQGQRTGNRITHGQRRTRSLSVSKTCIVLRFDRFTSTINTPPCLAFTSVNTNHAPSGIFGNEKLPCASH